MKRIVHLFVLLSICLLVGCIERSVVVKVSKDGTGVIHVRSYKKSVQFAFGSLANKQDSEADANAKTPKFPEQAELNKVAEKLGSGVRLRSAVAASNPQGWQGYEVVFEFDDVSQLRLDDQLFDLDDDKTKSSNDKESLSPNNFLQELSSPSNLRFALAGETLHITRHVAELDTQKAVPNESLTDDPFAKAPKSRASATISNAAMEGFLAQSLKDARIGLFVQFNGGIEATNAKFQAGNQITLMSFNLGKLVEQREKVEQLNSLPSQFEGDELSKQFQQSIDEIDGFQFDLNQEIFIR
ncbi:hypothetical protein Q31b_45370 [Novipirellula aureliae]|uniref:Lipoprotein n=1 Tax=Novipirellula aureliae TaxID=2527966 RepID=A0A5C6DLS7_9BACT|nr:hypothetical protein [Novipirellula aureliae]TWU37748.1 hypothetical protein Q31b_45370 [Novipirellula aureliae]